MKYKYKTLLFVLSLMMFSLLTFNTSFVCAETNKTTISFIDEDGNPIDIEDTVSITKLEDQGGIKVPVSVYIKDGKETTDYKNGKPLDELEIKDGKLEIEGLTKDNEYLLSFDNDYVFQKEENNETKYYMFGSFKGENDTSIYPSDLKSVEELSQKQLEEISGSTEIMELGTGWIKFTTDCKYRTVSVSASSSDKAVTCSGDRCSTGSATAGGGSYKISLSCGTKTGISYIWNTSNSSYTVSCSTCGYGNDECSNGSTKTVSSGYSNTYTQRYEWGDGKCDKSSDTRTQTVSAKVSTCVNYRWGTATGGTSSWSGSVSAPGCSKDNTTDWGTVYFNANGGSIDKTSESISRTVKWIFTGFSNFDANFTDNRTATANYSVSSTGDWSSVTLPGGSRYGYNLVGWSNGNNRYSVGQTITPSDGTTYTAIWEAKDVEYTIEFRSSTDKVLDTRKETHKFDETVTISHDPIPGYVVNDQQVKWSYSENSGYVLPITYQVIPYSIEYSLEIGNKRPSENPTYNPNTVTTYNVESDAITLKDASRTGYSFKGWYTDTNFTNKIDSIPTGSTGNLKLYAKFEANPYEYTIEFRSSTGKLLDTRKETHKFDETVTISHDPILGYGVSDRTVKLGSCL